MKEILSLIIKIIKDDYKGKLEILINNSNPTRKDEMIYRKTKRTNIRNIYRN
jgi:capsular polysaccharide biosynthesis protein